MTELTWREPPDEAEETAQLENLWHEIAEFLDLDPTAYEVMGISKEALASFAAKETLGVIEEISKVMADPSEGKANVAAIGISETWTTIWISAFLLGYQWRKKGLDREHT